MSNLQKLIIAELFVLAILIGVGVSLWGDSPAIAFDSPIPEPCAYAVEAKEWRVFVPFVGD